LTAVAFQVDRHVAGQSITGGVGGRGDRNGDEQGAPVVAHHTEQAQTGVRILRILGLNIRVLTLVLDGGRLRDTGAEVDGDDAEWDGGEEGDAPSEVLHGGGTPEVGS